MGRFRRRHATGDSPSVGRHGRPLHTERDCQAEAIREVLWLAGCQEWRDKGDGSVRGGFVVEDEDPTFLVCCTGGKGLDREREERGYDAALTAAGYVVEPITEDPDGGLRVWPLGQRPLPPAIDPRELLGDWLRSLTIIGEGKSIDDTLALIAKVNRVGVHNVPIRTPLPPDDRQAMESVLAWNSEIRSRQAGVNLLVEQLLIRWLCEATGQTWSQVVQRLALTIEDLLPPE